ncbi:hypothetical protein ACP6PL_21630, partial [Dapis sp. BLCC M126]|uniref:hypothetical protein n=1 Tax=Dapis sp. BLCC M126 TaxID=3400189 RepID=UPI003CF61D84
EHDLRMGWRGFPLLQSRYAFHVGSSAETPYPIDQESGRLRSIPKDEMARFPALNRAAPLFMSAQAPKRHIQLTKRKNNISLYSIPERF